MNENTYQKEIILLIRFSSFGDIVQTLSVPTALKNRFPTAEIHWVTRSEFVPLIEHHPAVHRVYGLDKKKGLRGLFQVIHQIKDIPFHRLYDAHNNLRSLVLSFALFFYSLVHHRSPPQVIRRSLRRWNRFLLFQFRINRFEQPFSGQRDLLEPLQPWGLSKTPPPSPQLFLAPALESSIQDRLLKLGGSPFITLAPSAAFPLKRWPLEHWNSLLKMWLKVHPEEKFILLGGPEDLFLKDLQSLDPERIFNFAGSLSLAESAQVVAQSKLLIANDTGLLHVGEQLGHPTLALMGPAPFGFPCRRETTRILELPLDCRPCSKHGQGPCSNPRYQWCLTGLRPEFVFSEAQKHLVTSSRPHSESSDSSESRGDHP